MLSRDTRKAMDDVEIMQEYYFDKVNGVIVCVSSHDDADEFKVLKEKVADALTSLIEILKKEEAARPTPVISRLHWALITNAHFYGKHQKAPLSFFDKTIIPNITIDQMGEVLSQLTNIDKKTACDFLLKLNACKIKCYSVDSNLISAQNLEYEPINNLSDFQKQMEKSINDILVKANESDRVSRPTKQFKKN